MSIPDFKTFSRLARKGRWVIFSEAVSADLETPVSAFLKISRSERSAFLFESVEQGEQIGRYSLLGTNPRQVISYGDDRTYIHERPFRKKPSVYVGDALSYIQFSMKKSAAVANPGSIEGFQGGYVGYLGYEMIQDFEAIRLRERGRSTLPRALFFLIDEFLVFDHLKHTLELAVLADTEDGLKSSYRNAIRRMNTLLRLLEKPLIDRAHERSGKSPAVRSNTTPSRFKNMVRRVKRYICAGDCIQVVVSQKFHLGRIADPFRIYRSLRSLNPSPYMFYLKHESLHLIGSSPEMLVKKSGSHVELRPIAGTRPRGGDEKEDGQNERDLTQSVKERAEHLMLVDLGRNDIGRVCDFKTVGVKNYARIEKYSHVMHLVSSVTGRISKNKDMFDLLRATFPAGTVTGAPKIRAIEIIDELEPDERGPYAGAVGYLSFSGDMDMCITIRTVVVQNRQATVQAGAGIVYDSDAAAEYRETVNKAKALFRAAEVARSGIAK